MIDFFNNDCLPVIPSKGSVGASGDLAPLSHMSLALMGIGNMKYKNSIISASNAIKQIGSKPIKLKAKEGLADVVVIGKRGEIKQDNDSKLGLNIERLVRSSKKPIFIANRKFVIVKKVLVAFDGSPSAKRIVDFISTCGFFHNAQITLASVGKPEKEIGGNFSEAKKVLNSQNIEVSIESLYGDPKFELSKLAKDNNFDLLIMGAYGHSKIRSYIVGSTTTRLINTVRLPVLLIR